MTRGKFCHTKFTSLSKSRKHITFKRKAVREDDFFSVLLMTKKVNTSIKSRKHITSKNKDDKKG